MIKVSGPSCIDRIERRLPPAIADTCTGSGSKGPFPTSIHWSCAIGLNLELLHEPYIQVLFYSLSRFIIGKINYGLFQIKIENVTAFDAGAYRCVVRMHEMDGPKTIAEFKSELIVFGEDYCTIEIRHLKHKPQIIRRKRFRILYVCKIITLNSSENLLYM